MKHTVEHKRIIGTKSLTKIISYINSAHIVHSDNMRSHTGGLMTIDLRLIYKKSTMQKINTKSMCESELVTTVEYLTHIIWVLMFMGVQGYEIDDTVIYQDNKSKIL